MLIQKHMQFVTIYKIPSPQKDRCRKLYQYTDRHTRHTNLLNVYLCAHSFTAAAVFLAHRNTLLTAFLQHDSCGACFAYVSLSCVLFRYYSPILIGQTPRTQEQTIALITSNKP